jgi:hypothetical protein
MKERMEVSSTAMQCMCYFCRSDVKGTDKEEGVNPPVM